MIGPYYWIISISSNILNYLNFRSRSYIIRCTWYI
nr:MAG TPA: hypothetical protein [Bacteriophage sp.]